MLKVETETWFNNNNTITQQQQEKETEKEKLRNTSRGVEREKKNYVTQTKTT